MITTLSVAANEGGYVIHAQFIQGMQVGKTVRIGKVVHEEWVISKIGSLLFETPLVANHGVGELVFTISQQGVCGADSGGPAAFNIAADDDDDGNDKETADKILHV